MSTTMPDTLRNYVDTTNNLDTEAFIGLFANGACVHDEGHYYCGIKAIREWREATYRKYQFTMKPLDVKEQGTETLLTAELTGNFPGSPATLMFDFEFRNGKISKLYIRS